MAEIQNRTGRTLPVNTRAADAMREQDGSTIFALDIGTRSIIGVVGRVEDGKLHVLAIEKENHGQRAMLDGQIENIAQVAAAAKIVIGRLEKKTRIRLARVCVAAAGRALKSENATFGLELSSTRPTTPMMLRVPMSSANTTPGSCSRRASAARVLTGRDAARSVLLRKSAIAIAPLLS